MAEPVSRRTHPAAVLAVLLAAAFLLSVSVGSVPIPFGETLRVLMHAAGPSTARDGSAVIVGQVRLPRVILAALAGASLSVSGAAMQGLLRNPLADSSTLGVSSGAALGAASAIAVGVKIPLFPYLGIALTGILSAFGSFLLILAFARRIDRSFSTGTIILTGIVVSLFAGSLISLLESLSAEHLKDILFWTMGSFAGRGWDYVVLLLPFAAVGIVGLLRYSRELNAFALGEENAGYIGVDVPKVKIRIMALVSVLVGASVSVSGSIAFVGLMIPHAVRLLTGPNHRSLLPLSAMGGAAFLMLTDLAARTVLSPSELPVGVVTSLLGSVIFLAVFDSRRHRPV